MIFRLLLSTTLLFSTLCSSDENLTTDEEDYIDKSHREISNYVKELANYIDRTLDENINNYKDKNATKSSYDTNTTIPISSKNSELKEDSISQNIDTFFQNKKFINETEKSFIQLITEANINSLDKSKFKLKLKASLPLSRSKKNVKLFISGKQDNIEDFPIADQKTLTNSEIGISVFGSLNKKIGSKYSVGIHGIYPFVRARYSIGIDTNLWRIEPVQTFQYSAKDDFTEYTRIYFDTKLTEMTLFRLELGRGTKSTEDGMEYDAVLHLFWIPKPKTGLQFTQIFFGNTKYKYIYNESVVLEENDTYSGIHNYLTSITWRQSIFRKWLFYELAPGINFSRDYDYHPNYRMHIRLDFFFGDI